MKIRPGPEDFDGLLELALAQKCATPLPEKPAEPPLRDIVYHFHTQTIVVDEPSSIIGCSTIRSSIHPRKQSRDPSSRTSPDSASRRGRGATATRRRANQTSYVSAQMRSRSESRLLQRSTAEATRDSYE